MFWDSVNKLHAIKEEDSNVIRQEAMNIFRTFIQDGCEFQVNIDSEVVEEIERQLSLQTHKFSKFIFDDAQTFIFDLMKNLLKYLP